MTANRHQDQASPRFARGLALLGCSGALALLVYGSLPKRSDSVVSPHSIPAAAPAAGVPAEQLGSRGLLPHAAPENRWAEACREIAAETDLSRREERCASLLEAAASSDLTAVLAELHHAGFGADDFTRRLLRRWVEADVRAAAAWAEQLPAGAVRAAALSDVAVEWANADLKSAAEWAQQLSEPAEQQTALLAIANEAVRTEPMEALRLAVDLPAGANRDETIRRAAMEWAEQDGPGATDWAKQITDVALREKVMAAEAVAWAETAPEAAATFALESLPAGRLLEDTVLSIVQRWAQQQPQQAATWVAQFPPGELQVAAVESVAAMWGAHDQPSAEAWRNGMVATP
jgi:hypothetical protein